MFKFFIPFSFFILLQVSSAGQETDYWKIEDRETIMWDLTQEERLPHSGNIEMAGRKVASIIYYDVDENRNLSIKRDVIFPQLRTFNKSYDPDWKKYRAYYRHVVEDEIMPSIIFKNKAIVATKLDSVEISGKLKFYHSPIEGLQIIRTFYPSMKDRFLVEEWEIKNTASSESSIDLTSSVLEKGEKGYKGDYRFKAFGLVDSSVTIAPKASYVFPIYYAATMNEESFESFNYELAFEERNAFLKTMQSQLVLKSPNEVINTLFYFSKLRASESIFDSSMGMVHSPGGGNYYVGIWANDQIEYSGPFFPYLGYGQGNEAAYNAYVHFGKNIPEDDHHIPYAFEVDGNFAMTHLDRGDAAMIAYGASHYALATGDKKVMGNLWPLIEWSLRWCDEHRNDGGAVISESDEMEGRIETGTANLSTSSLYYGGLKYAERLAKTLGKKNLAKQYAKQKKDMEQVIEQYFGAEINGVNTYQYFDGNKYLRHWICLPLSMGVRTRKEGTIDALLNHLWTENGILVELNPDVEQTVFWDRATMYALQGIMKVGETDLAYEKLLALSQKRLLGDHVPYVVEAYPENNMKHLSAESALYCRIITEGMLGIEPMGDGKIKLRPRLPKDWGFLELSNLALLGKDIDINIRTSMNKLKVQVSKGEEIIFTKLINQGEEIYVDLK